MRYNNTNKRLNGLLGLLADREAAATETSLRTSVPRGPTREVAPAWAVEWRRRWLA